MHLLAIADLFVAVCILLSFALNSLNKHVHKNILCLLSILKFFILKILETTREVVSYS